MSSQQELAQLLSEKSDKHQTVTQKFSQYLPKDSQPPGSQLLEQHYKAYGGTEQQLAPSQSVAAPSQSQYTQAPLPEPLLEENPNRFVILPIVYKDIWKRYKDQMACFWTVDEIDLSQDTKDWQKLS